MIAKTEGKDTEPVTKHIKDESSKHIIEKAENGLREIEGTNKKLRLKIWRSHFEAMATRADILRAYEAHPRIELDIKGREEKTKGYLETREDLEDRGFSNQEIRESFSTLFNISALENAGKYVKEIPIHKKYDIPNKYKMEIIGVPTNWVRQNLPSNAIELLDQLDLISISENSSHSFSGVRVKERGRKIAEEYFFEELWDSSEKIEDVPFPLQYSIIHPETTPITQETRRVDKRVPRTADRHEFDENCLVQTIFDQVRSMEEYERFWTSLENQGIAVKGPSVSREITTWPNDRTKTPERKQEVKADHHVRYTPLFAAKKILDSIEKELHRNGLIPRLLMYLNRKPAKLWNSENERGLPQYGLTKKENLKDLEKMIDHLHGRGVASEWVDKEIPYTLRKSKFEDYLRKYLLGETIIEI